MQHMLGIKYKGKGIGSYGDASIFSFHATKVFNTIEGGAVTFSEHKMYDKLYNLKNFGIRGEELVVDVGANAKMNEFCAIMGLCNLKHIDENIENRRKRYETYFNLLNNIQGVKLFNRNQLASNNYAYLPILIINKYSKNRDYLYDFLKKNGVFARKYFYPITADAECFEGKYKNVKLWNARRLSEEVLVIPLFSELEQSWVNKICDLIKEVASK